MTIKDHVLMICDLCGIEGNSESIVDYEKGKQVLSLRFYGSDYQQAIKVLAEYIGV